MTRLKRFKIGLFTITLGMVLVGASFALADDKAVAEGIIPPKELNETTAILAPSVAIAENEPTTQPEEWIDAVATAYCPCEICCGKWALNRPDGIVYTASGAIAEEDVTIAADWSVYSPGTILYIEGIGERTVQDRGGAIRDPELKYTPQGTAVTSFTLAVDRRFNRDKADYINIIAWRQTAEFVAKHFAKGQRVAVVGSIQTRSWEDNDGGKHKAVEIVADSVYFADAKKESAAGSYAESAMTSEGFEVTDEDIPF